MNDVEIYLVLRTDTGSKHGYETYGFGKRFSINFVA